MDDLAFAPGNLIDKGPVLAERATGSTDDQIAVPVDLNAFCIFPSQTDNG
jgi:hypothetical protein